MLLKTRDVIDGERFVPMTLVENQLVDIKLLNRHGYLGMAGDVAQPQNEGTSHDVDENKGKCPSAAGTSQDVIENTQLVCFIPGCWSKQKR